MDAIALLKKQHREVEALFKRFEKAGAGAGKLKRKLVDQITEAVSRHSAIEEAIFYPAAKQALADLGKQEMIFEALEEHHVVKWELDALLGMKPSAERFNAKVTVLMESLRHHVKEEETQLFPQLKKLLAKDQLDALGLALEQAWKVAPTRPHPSAPDEPPGNLLTSPLAAIADRAGDLMKGALRRRPRLPSSGHVQH